MHAIKKQLSKKGQSTVEYVLLFAAVVAVLIIFLAPGTGVFSVSVDQAVDSARGEVDVMSGRMVGSH